MSDINPIREAEHQLYREACNDYRAASTPQDQAVTATRAAYHAALPAIRVAWKLRASQARKALRAMAVAAVAGCATVATFEGCR